MRRSTFVVTAVLSAALLGVVTNVASSQLPADWEQYAWLAWPLVILLAGILIAVEVRRDRSGGAVASGYSRFHRNELLHRVEVYWVKGVLEKSLYHEARVELGLAATVHSIHPWDVVSRYANGVELAITQGTPVREIFDQLGHSMLILGAPGAGKTTMMLELLRDLVEEARTTADSPVPVVLNLSSWALRQDSLEEWLIREVANRYEIPQRYVRRWVEQDQLLPLLDGLDEVDEEARDACVTAINVFRAEHGSVPIVVCCRSADYAEMQAELRTYGTLTIQPLTPAQVEDFLDRAGAAVAGVRVALAADPGLWELMESPLMLSVVALAFGGDSAERVAEPVDDETRRDQLFQAYVRTMLLQRPSKRYRPKLVLRFMAVLAERLNSVSQTVFTMDLINTYWLPARYWWRAEWLPGIVLGAVGAALLGPLGYYLLNWRGAVLGGLVGLGLGASEYHWLDGQGLALRAREDRQEREVSAEDWVFSLLPLPDSAFQAWVAVLFAALAAPLFGWDPELGWGQNWQAWVGYGVGAGVGIFLALLYADNAAYSVSRRLSSVASRSEVPSPLARGALRFAVVIGPVTALILFSITALIVAWPLSLTEGTALGALLGAAALLRVVSELGGYATIEQRVIRRTLRRKGVFPRPARPLLDYAAQCLFLRRVGYGYIFVHRELLDFFAARKTDEAYANVTALDRNLAKLLP